MLLIRASARPSSIHGLGLFADEPISQGAPIWELRAGFDVTLSPAEVESLSPAAREQTRRFLYLDIATEKYVLCSDDAKYMNHAPQPNTSTTGAVTVALRDIEPGEELTCDYAEFDAVTREKRGA